jgi:imidazolonepropionase-like amidohydrolase
MTKDAGVWVVPTQSLMERWAGPIPPQELANGDEMKYISKEILESWVNRKIEFQGNPTYDPEKADRFNLVRRKIIKALHEEGVGILLGSDAPQIFNVPGFSIQHELFYMVESGLSTFETLKSGTINPAIYFDMEGQFGTITEGAAADLILLNANPLDDITNVSDRAGVMVRGKWLSEEEISERLNQIAVKYAEED